MITTDTSKTFFTVLLSAVLMLLMSCHTQPAIENNYRAWLESPGGELAFPLHLQQIGNELTGYVINGIDTTRFSAVTVEGDSIKMSFAFYDSHLIAKIDKNGTLNGYWKRRAEKGTTDRLPFHANTNMGYDRYPATQPDGYAFDGEWQTTFVDSDGAFPAHGVFISENSGQIHGTFATETGDYRFLEGFYTDSSMTLSTFDGAHAFLFKADLKPDGDLKGDFWSRDSYHATFTAQKGANKLRNPMQISASDVIGKKMEFAFPDLEGDTVSVDDERFENKPILVYLFGSWCPNCADEAKMLKEMVENEFSDTELQIIGLAFEYTGNLSSDTEMVRKYKKRFNIPWTLLVAGISDKESAAKVLPFIEDVVSFPTSFFVDDNHRIQSVHVGFNGPATGARYYKEKMRFHDNITAIVE